MPVLRPDLDQLHDAVQLATGAYSPLDGFMDRAFVESVLATSRLPTSLPWPIPIVLTPAGRPNEATIATLRPGDEVALVDPSDRFIARLTVRELFPFDRTAVARDTFGTTDPAHPNVAQLARAGPVAIAGRVDLLRPPAVPFPELELTPIRARELFRRRGWTTVAGFQTRNLPHAGHEQLHRLTLERGDVDGLFLHPIVGPRQAGDYRPDTVVAGYQELTRRYYPPSRFALATLTVGMRYAGPRAALFFAIMRKNFGCTHYIVGRDQAGVGGFYDPYACHRIFDEFPIDIVALRYQELFYCTACRAMASDRTCAHPAHQRTPVSQTRIRKALADGEPVPPEIIRPEILAIARRAFGRAAPSVDPPPAPTPPTDPAPATVRGSAWALRGGSGLGPG